ncbi:MAG: ferrous iron transport protein B [Saprospiraceae bacterium]|nr:ferrous iron transport protein B [Saprospiraceae bacterium]|tara:strand:- start:3376 stop:5499 length:2124 start_codon:yes stop_codon:yes gene_type:complete
MAKVGLKKIALIGNPNSGKSSLFNSLTGLRQKVGNYPGVTVDKKSGILKVAKGEELEIIDFPGIYSFYPNSSDERIVIETLTNPKSKNFPNAIVYVVDSLDIEKHFLLATQLREMNLPMLVVFSMADLAFEKGIKIDTTIIEEYLECPCISISTRTGENLEVLKLQIENLLSNVVVASWSNAYNLSETEREVSNFVVNKHKDIGEYIGLQIAHHYSWLGHLNNSQKNTLRKKVAEFDSVKYQIRETMDRYNRFTTLVKKATKRISQGRPGYTERIDNITTHRVIGPILFTAIMLLVFQAIYAWAEWPMNMIEETFIGLSSAVNSILAEGWFSNLLTEGIIAGLGGIMVFIPQIAILFFLISILEEIGYMSRVVFMFDGLMQRFGLNGRSIVALISGGACAIPAIMSARTISNWKERMITIMVTPLISCSARIPVYTVLIGFVVSDTLRWGPFNVQGLAFMGLYVIGILAALFSALIFKWILKSDEQSVLMIELPKYKKPMWNNVFHNVKEKVWTFIVEAGKVILVVSVVLWFLVSYGPKGSMERTAQEGIELAQEYGYSAGTTQQEDLLASKKMEGSYAGIIGKSMEPCIRPLGYDWKIGIALLTSFAAREVFVGTMATIYSVGSSEEERVIKERMAAEINPATGKPVYTFATALSLLLFYVFALQCMSTLAVTKRETKSWKWPALQFTFMGAMAYVSAFAAYQIFS